MIRNTKTIIAGKVQKLYNIPYQLTPAISHRDSDRSVTSVQTPKAFVKIKGFLVTLYCLALYYTYFVLDISVLLHVLKI